MNMAIELPGTLNAHMWFNISASRIPAAEEEKRRRVVRNRDRVAALLTPAQLTQAQRMASNWRP